MDGKAQSPMIRLVTLLAVLGVCMVAGSYLLWTTFRTPTVSGMVNGQLTHTVERGNLLISFTERGNVKAASSVPVYCRLEGRSTIVSVVPDGTHVEEGDLLVELDSSQLAEQLNKQQISVDSASADLEQAREQVKIQESLNNSSIQKAELEVLLAEIDLEKYKDGDWPLALEKAKAEIFIAEEELARAEIEHDWTRKLAEKGYATMTKLRADSLAVEKAKVQEKQALGSLEVLEDYTRRKDLETYKSALQQAKDALDREKRQAAAEMSKVLAGERAKTSTHELSVQHLEKLQDQLAKTKIEAPQSGMVVYETGEGRRGPDRAIEAGADVFENQLLMKLPDVTSMAVDVQVHESWVDQVTEGQAALVSFDSQPNMKMSAKVTKVGVLPDHVNRWLNPDLKVYKTELVIEETEEGASLLKPGMSAKVQILIKKLTGVLFVPIQSVTTVDKDQVVYALDGGKFVPRRIECGRANESFIEILSGVEAGTVVMLNAPPPKGGDTTEEVPDFEEVEKPDRNGNGRDPRSFANPGRGGSGGRERAGGGSRAGGRGAQAGSGARHPGGGSRGAASAGSGERRPGGPGSSKAGGGERRPGGPGSSKAGGGERRPGGPGSSKAGGGERRPGGSGSSKAGAARPEAGSGDGSGGATTRSGSNSNASGGKAER